MDMGIILSLIFGGFLFTKCGIIADDIGVYSKIKGNIFFGFSSTVIIVSLGFAIIRLDYTLDVIVIIFFSLIGAVLALLIDYISTMAGTKKYIHNKRKIKRIDRYKKIRVDIERRK